MTAAASAEADFAFTIDLPVSSDWDNIPLVRSSVEMCLSTLFHGIDSQHTLAMVTGELLENAVKYGNWIAPASVFRLRLWGIRGREAFVAVSNQVASDAVAASVIGGIETLNRSGAPADAYRARMVEIAGSEPGAGSRLGFLRIAYEGGAHLDARAVDGILTVTARLALC